MAGRVLDLTGRITNELPMIKVNDEIIVTVNNRKSTILSMQLLVKEQEKKAKESNEEYDELAFMDIILEMLLGKKSADAISEMDLPLPEYKTIYNAVMASATGKTLEEAEEEEKRFQEQGR